MAKSDSIPAPAGQAMAPQAASMITVVTGVVADILGIAEVPPQVSVFDLGANSVAIAGICARLEQATGVKVQITQLFRTPTAAELAGWLEARRAAGSDGTHAGGTGNGQRAAAAAPGGLVALTPIQALSAGLGIVSHHVWWLEGELDPQALRLAAADVHRRHQALWARYVTSGPAVGFAMVPSDPGEPELHWLPEAGSDAAAVADLRPVLLAPLRIEDGVVWRLVLIRSAQSGRHLFAVGCDHTAFDGTSAGIVTRELDIAYRARSAGQEPDFGPPAATLAEIGEEYAAQLASTDLGAQREYWLAEFDGVQPCYFPGRSQAQRPAGTGPVAEPTFTFTPDQLAAWHDYGQARGMTIFVWLAAALTRAVIQAGAPQDIGFMFGIAYRGSDLVFRSVTCRMIFAMLRPGGPARKGGNLLARTHDAYVQAMANAEGRLVHDEISGAIGKSETEFPVLQALPHVVVLESPARTIRLGAATGYSAPEFGAWGTGPADLSVEIVHGTADDDVVMKIASRTDAYPADLAGQIGALFCEVIRGGPELLEQQTAS